MSIEDGNFIDAEGSEWWERMDGEGLADWLEHLGVEEAMVAFNHLPPDRIPEKMSGLRLDWREWRELIAKKPVYSTTEVRQLFEAGVFVKGDEDWSVLGCDGRVEWLVAVEPDGEEEGVAIDYISQLYYLDKVKVAGDRVLEWTEACEVRIGSMGVECQFYILSPDEVAEPQQLIDPVTREFRDSLVVAQNLGELRVALRHGVEEAQGWLRDDWIYQDEQMRVLTARHLIVETEGSRLSATLHRKEGKEVFEVFRFFDGERKKLEMEVYQISGFELPTTVLLKRASGLESNEIKPWIRLVMEEDEICFGVVELRCDSYQLDMESELKAALYENGEVKVVGYLPAEVGKRMGLLPGVDGLKRGLGMGAMMFPEGCHHEGCQLDILEVPGDVKIWPWLADVGEDWMDYELVLVFSWLEGKVLEWSLMPGERERIRG